MRVAFTTAARDDLTGIALHIAKDNLERAFSYVDEIEKSCEALARNSDRLSLVPGYEETNVRRRVHGNYLIFYRVVEETVQIPRIVHGATAYEAALFGGKK